MPTDINDHNVTESLTAIDLVALHDISLKGKHKRNAQLRSISSSLKNNIKVMQKNLNIATQQINKIQRIELYEQKKTLDARVQVADEQTKELELNVAIVQQHAIYLASYLKIRNQHIT